MRHRILMNAGLRTFASVLALSTTLVTAAAADEDKSAAPAADKTADANKPSVEKVTVTSLKRSTVLQRTPAAITALTNNDLNNRQIRTVDDVAAQVPGMAVGQSSGITSLSIRGISLDVISGLSEGSIAAHLDGVYMSRPTSANFLMMDIDSVEVLRGPQGTLYGRNATGGTVNFQSRLPTEELDVSARIAAGSFESVRANAAISGSIADGVLVRVSGMFDSQYEGFTKNLANGNTLEQHESGGGRVAVRLLPADDLTIDLSTYYFREDFNGEIFSNITPIKAAAIALNPAYATSCWTTKPHEICVDREPDGKKWITGATGKVGWDISPNVTFKSISSWIESDYSRFNSDADGSTAPLGISNRADDMTSYQQEFNLNATMFDDRLDWLFGAYYNAERLRLLTDVPWLASNPQGFVNINGSVLPAGTAVVAHALQETESQALFTDATLAITDSFRVYGGARATWDTKDLSQTAGISGLPNNVGIQCNNAHYEASFDSVTGKAGVQLDVDDERMIYAQWQEGFKGGGFNASSCNDVFEPEIVTAYEAGLKGSYFSGALRLNLAAFYYDYSDLQVFQIVNFSSRIENAASATVKGVEAEGIARLAEGLQANLAFSWLDATYEDFHDLDTLNPLAGVQDLSGNRLNRAPEYTVNLGLDYRFALGDAGTATLRGEVYHSADVFYRQFNTASEKQDAYTTGNLFVSFVPEARQNLTFRAFVKNVTDEDVIVGLFSSGLSQNLKGQYAPPRTWGLELSAAY